MTADTLQSISLVVLLGACAIGAVAYRPGRRRKSRNDGGCDQNSEPQFGWSPRDRDDDGWCGDGDGGGDGD